MQGRTPLENLDRLTKVASNLLEQLADPRKITVTGELESFKRAAEDCFFEVGPSASEALRRVAKYRFDGIPETAAVEQIRTIGGWLSKVRQRITTGQGLVGERPQPKEPRAPRQKKLTKYILAPAHRAGSRRRARTIAKLIGELDTLKGQMNTEEDYPRLAQQHRNFRCFKIAKNNPELRTKLENVQAHQQHIRLAQELAAAHHGVTLSTAQTDWKRKKPQQFRRGRG